MGIEDLEQVNMHEAKTHLSRLVERVEAGAEIVINRAGTPAAKLVPVEEKKPGPRKLGGWKGKVWISPDFDEPDEELERLFYDGELFPSESPEGRDSH
ncbi:MAG TPA: type II toxin-antitoxin system Phd/YefM family antitoxin [Solirubrobacterales bacterium]|jgi:prevent-host-death family protein|nr:type II toxin-antitoxin system Phd/YefM family antitoxin [Solirubrobacterales bacterium]